jgi:hypothetical protein
MPLRVICPTIEALKFGSMMERAIVSEAAAPKLSLPVRMMVWSPIESVAPRDSPLPMLPSMLEVHHNDQPVSVPSSGSKAVLPGFLVSVLLFVTVSLATSPPPPAALAPYFDSRSA